MECLCVNKFMLNEFPWEQAVFFCPDCQNYWFREGLLQTDGNYEYKFWRLLKTGDFTDHPPPPLADEYFGLIKNTVLNCEKSDRKIQYQPINLKSKRL